MIEDDNEIITLYYGKEIEESDAMKTGEKLEEKYLVEDILKTEKRNLMN